jgi:trk system potassium uptake protein TrkH
VHAFSAISTGGFSSHDASVGFFNSPLIESVLIVIMLLGGINFATHFLVWQRRTMAPYRTDPEVGTYLVVLALSSVMLAVYLWSHSVYADGLTALRYAAFNTISLATTTGFANVDYSLWPVFAPLWMMFLGIFSTCSGSTGGGIKMVRAQLLFKQAFREMGRLVHPQALMPVKLGGHIIANQIVFAVLAFLSLYGMSLLALSFLLVMSGLDYVTAFSAVVACMNTIGPALNQLGPAGNYVSLTDFQTWVCTTAMLLGRLEVFTLLVLFTPAFWRR